MKRSVGMILAAFAAVVLFGGIVYAVLVAAQVSQPGPATVYGITARRAWASAAALLAAAGVITGGVALARPGGSVSSPAALSAGLIAAVNGALNLGVASGGPGTGNGVVGGAVAFVLGLSALALGGLALTRSRATAPQRERTR